MALAIVPLDRNSGFPCPEESAPSNDVSFDVEDIPFNIPLSPDPLDDLDALTVELEETEGLSAVEARSQALTLSDELASFAAVWDTDAFLAGNPAAAAIVQPLDPLPSIEQRQHLAA